MKAVRNLSAEVEKLSRGIESDIARLDRVKRAARTDFKIWVAAELREMEIALRDAKVAADAYPSLLSDYFRSLLNENSNL